MPSTLFQSILSEVLDQHAIAKNNFMYQVGIGLSEALPLVIYANKIDSSDPKIKKFITNFLSTLTDAINIDPSNSQFKNIKNELEKKAPLLIASKIPEMKQTPANFDEITANKLKKTMDNLGVETTQVANSLLPQAREDEKTKKEKLMTMPEMQTALTQDKAKEKDSLEKDRAKGVTYEGAIEGDPLMKSAGKLLQDLNQHLKENNWSKYGPKAQVEEKINTIDNFLKATGNNKMLISQRSNVGKNKILLNETNNAVGNLKDSFSLNDLENQYAQAKKDLKTLPSTNKKQINEAKNKIEAIDKINRLVFGDSKKNAKLDFGPEISKALDAIDAKLNDVQFKKLAITATQSSIVYQALKDKILPIRTELRERISHIFSKKFVESEVLESKKGGLDGSYRKQRDNDIEKNIKGMEDLVKEIEKLIEPRKEATLLVRATSVSNPVISEPIKDISEIKSMNELKEQEESESGLEAPHEELDENDDLDLSQEEFLAKQKQFVMVSDQSSQDSIDDGLKSESEIDYTLPNFIDQSDEIILGNESGYNTPTFRAE